MSEEFIDPDTGEVIRRVATEQEFRPQQPQQETLPPEAGRPDPQYQQARPIERAADGGTVPSAAFTGGAFVDQVQDGQFQQDFHRAIAELAESMIEVHHATGKKVAGKATMTIDFSYEDGAFRVGGEFTTKKPKLPRARSIMWTDDDGNFTRFPPNQRQLFGVQQVGQHHALRQR